MSKFDTTANFTPDSLRALNTSSAPVSLRCHAYMGIIDGQKYQTLRNYKKYKKKEYAIF